MSDLPCQFAGMKLKSLVWWQRSTDKTLTTFGKARLIRKPTGRIELVGGSVEDRIAAKEWVSLFLHEAIV